MGTNNPQDKLTKESRFNRIELNSFNLESMQKREKGNGKDKRGKLDRDHQREGDAYTLMRANTD